MNRRQKIIVSITGIFIVMIALVGLTYAYFLTRITGNENEKSISVTTANLELLYGDGNNVISMSNIMPGDPIPAKTFTVTNKGNATVENYKVYLESIQNQLELKDDLKYTLTCKSYKTTDTTVDFSTLTEDGTCTGAETTTFPSVMSLIATNTIDVGYTHYYELQLSYPNQNYDQSVDMNKLVSAKVNIYDERTKVEDVSNETEVTEFTYTEGTLLNYDTMIEATNANYRTTSFIPCEPGYKYTITETQTFDCTGTQGTVLRTVLYDENYNPIYVATNEVRTEIRVYTHTFEVPVNARYFKVAFRVTDEDISITKTKENQTLVYSTAYNYIQGLTVSEDYIFVGHGKETAKNEYKLTKLDRSTGEVLATSTQSFNHTNDMTYNSKTNEVIITGLHGDAGLTEDAYDENYTLNVADAATLTLKETINLKDEVLSLCSESLGISAVDYNENLDEYYALTRYPERYVIILDNNFEMKSSVRLETLDDAEHVGGIYVDDNYFYISNMIDYNGKTNEVFIYDKTGKLVDTKSVNGINHIEGIDYIDGQYYLSFTAVYGNQWMDSLNEAYGSKIYTMPELKDIQ